MRKMGRDKPSHWLLRCHVCERTIPGTLDELTRHLGDWPRCCGELMSVFFEAKLPETPPADQRRSSAEPH
jgi:hypothetical protein